MLILTISWQESIWSNTDLTETNKTIYNGYSLTKAPRFLPSLAAEQKQQMEIQLPPAAGKFSSMCKEVGEQLGNARCFWTSCCYVIQNNVARSSSRQRQRQPSAGLAHAQQLLLSCSGNATSGYKWSEMHKRGDLAPYSLCAVSWSHMQLIFQGGRNLHFIFKCKTTW